MTAQQIMIELENLSTEMMKKRHISRGAREPLFGVATGAMKPIFKQIGINHVLAEELYATGNYDAMYFAGMIADPLVMTPSDFDRWMQTAYFFMLSDFVVAVTLSESPCVMDVADDWLDNDNELYRSAAWSAYQWLIGWRNDDFFDKDRMTALLTKAVAGIDGETKHVQGVINDFVAAVGVSYIPLHDAAMQAAKEHGLKAEKTVQQAIDKNKLGFKRRAVRC
ncbi:MAG: DNA alkylation repair protein [Defluviitaleaceae bacterium]|nr:DNA alkylation repair protein [Defluviitaleaceae bacterium]